jgi:histone-lysine N-methyltransferase SETD3
VPRSLLLSCADAERLAPPVHASLASGALRQEAALALLLLTEASRADSSRAVYLHSLPSSYSDAAGWSEAAQTQLQAPHAVARCAELRSERRADWLASEALHLSLPPRLRSFAAWSWAASTVATRTVFVGDTAGALCPVGDLANSRLTPEGCECGSGRLTETHFEFVTAVDVDAGAQLFVAYGSHSSLDLLCLYGSLPAETQPDSFILPSHLLGPDIPSEPPPSISSTGEPCFALLASLRLAAAPRALRREMGHSAASGNCLSLQSEAVAFGRLRKALQMTLDAMPSSVEEDDAELSALTHPDQNLVLAVRWRLRYKQALRRGVEMASERLAWVDRQSAGTDGRSVVVRQ